MRKIYFLIFFIVGLFIFINSYFYINIYNQQLDFQTELLSQQISICGNTIEQNGMDFESEVNYILFSSNISELFSDSENKERNLKNLELFYTKYEDLINNIYVYNDNNQVYRLLKDKGNNYVRDFYESQRQEILEEHDMLKVQNGEYQLIIPVFIDNQVKANIVVCIDYERYINTVFDQYHLQNTIWQWFVTKDGELSVSHPENIEINNRDIDKITKDILEGNTGSLVHSLNIDGEHVNVISVFYPVTLIRKDFGIVFSIKSDLFLRSIFLKTIIITLLSLLMLALIHFINLRLFKTGLKGFGKFSGSETFLSQIIDDFLTGLILIAPDKSIKFINKKALKFLNIPSSAEDKELIHSVRKFLDSPSFSEVLYEKYLGPGRIIRYNDSTFEKILYLQDIKIHSVNQELSLLVLTDLSQYEKILKHQKATSKAKYIFLEQIRKYVIASLLQIKKQVTAIEQGHENKNLDEYLKIICKSANLLSDLVNSSFDFSLDVEEKSIIAGISFRLRNELSRITENLKNTFNSKKISLITKIRDDVPDRVIGDPFLLRQILSDLMELSLSLTGEGRILLSAETLVHSYDHLKIKFLIEDTSPGLHLSAVEALPRNESDHVYESFNEPASKLGNIRKQLELLNGELLIESPSSLSTNPDCPGTRYTLIFDLIPDQSHKKHLDFSGITEISAINCLILSKEESAEEEFMSPFHEMGCTVKQHIYSLDNLDDTMNFLSGKINEFQVILIHDRPKENDLELLTFLKDHKLDNSYLVVVLNTDDQINNFLQFKRSGADYYLIHPYDLGQLAEILSHHFPGLNSENLRSHTGAQIKKDIKILLVEDNIIRRKEAIINFKKLGFEIDCMSRGTDVIESLSVTSYDIIFLDLLSSEKDGNEIAAEIRSLGYKLPIIGLTTSDSADKGKTKKTTGINSYLLKPLRLSDIRRTLLQNFPVKN